MVFNSHFGFLGALGETAPCPVCARHIYRGQARCLHCGHMLSGRDIQLLKQYMSLQRTRGWQMRLNMLPIAMLLLFWLFLLVN